MFQAHMLAAQQLPDLQVPDISLPELQPQPHRTSLTGVMFDDALAFGNGDPFLSNTEFDELIQQLNSEDPTPAGASHPMDSYASGLPSTSASMDLYDPQLSQFQMGDNPFNLHAPIDYHGIGDALEVELGLVGLSSQYLPPPSSQHGGAT
jgi:hypothetical protein